MDAIEIWPEPSPEEREAIALALCHVKNHEAGQTRPRSSPWAEAGRREAVYGRMLKTFGSGRRRAGRLPAW